MQFTFDLNTTGYLILSCEPHESSIIQELTDSETGEFDCNAEYNALESLLANSELGWITPEEIGALTDAPILGLRDENGKPTSAWAFMDYQVRSFLQDLVDNGEAVFVGGTL